MCFFLYHVLKPFHIRNLTFFIAEFAATLLQFVCKLLPVLRVVREPPGGRGQVPQVSVRVRPGEGGRAAQEGEALCAGLHAEEPGHFNVAIVAVVAVVAGVVVAAAAASVPHAQDPAECLRRLPFQLPRLSVELMTGRLSMELDYLA